MDKKEYLIQFLNEQREIYGRNLSEDEQIYVAKGLSLDESLSTWWKTTKYKTASLNNHFPEQTEKLRKEAEAQHKQDYLKKLEETAKKKGYKIPTQDNYVYWKKVDAEHPETYEMEQLVNKTKKIQDDRKAQAQQAQQEKNKLSYKIGEGVKKQTDSVKNTATKAGEWVKNNPKKQVAGGVAAAAATGGLLLLRKLLKQRAEMKKNNQSTTNIDNQIKNVRNKMKTQ